jgi:hypothetical protein
MPHLLQGWPRVICYHTVLPSVYIVFIMARHISGQDRGKSIMARAKKKTATAGNSGTKKKTRRRTAGSATTTTPVRAAAAPKRRGRPKQGTAKTSAASDRLAHERAQKERWRAAAKDARQQLKEAVKAQKAAEKLARKMERLNTAKEKAIQSFASQWERKYFGALASQLQRPTRGKRKAAPRRTAAA